MLIVFAQAAHGAEVSEYVGKAHQLVAEKKYEEAIAQYTEALKISPKNAQLNMLIGLTYASAGKMDKALEYTKIAVELDPSYASYYNLGLMYSATKEMDKALEAFDKSLSLNPKSYHAAHQKGLVYSEQKDYVKAAEAFAKAVELNPDFEDGYIALVAAYSKKGDKESIKKLAAELRKAKKDALAAAFENEAK